VINLLRDARGIEEGQAVGDWVHNRKAFMEAFSIAIQDKIQNDVGSLNPITLARALHQAIEDRHLQIYMTDPEVATELDAIGWDGRLPQAPPGDFLMVVDTNMGYNKSNVYVQRSTNYRVFLDGATPNAELTVHYSHTGPDKDEPCYQGTAEEYAQSLPYLASAEKCYWNYLRVYAPAGSDLFQSSRHVVPGESLFSGETWNSTAEPVNELPGLSTFANFLLVTNGRSESSTFAYRLPGAVLQPEEEGRTVRYRLQVFKQAGTGAEPFSLAVTLPDTAEPVNISPQPARVEHNTIYFEKVLTANTEFIIDFRRP
jgi:hypothetical protein